MRITTAEIKMLLKERAANQSVCTIRDFEDYITKRSGKEFTKGQLSGALYQLSQSGDLLSVDRGLYQGCAVASTGHDNGESELSDADLNSSGFVREIRECLTSTMEELTRISNNNSVLDMDRQEFELLTDVKKLKEELEGIVGRYR